MGYSKITVDEIEAAGPGGVVRFVRRELGCEAFAGPDGLTTLAVGAPRGSYQARRPF
jgi:hypothetical protein